ncbi:hypothetical protein N9I61_01745 [Flavobacteriales bacterium]|nr:hypothetical protein [Flavobacteriales bacterium]
MKKKYSLLRQAYHKDGALVLHGLLGDDFVSILTKHFQFLVSSPSDKYQSGFYRVGYDLFEDLDALKDVLMSPDFRELMFTLHREELIFTQALGFELFANTSKGFPWHIGTQSFGYQRAEDFGCTIWIPLMPIKPEGKRGGMKYIKRSDVSGAFMYRDIDPRVFQLLESREADGIGLTEEEYKSFRDGPLNDPGMRRILDAYQVEPELALGDAILFDKNIIHSSVPLNSESNETRQAIALRFISPKSRFDQQRADRLEIPRRMLNMRGPTNFHLNLGLEDGQLIKESPMFADKMHIRWLQLAPTNV